MIPASYTIRSIVKHKMTSALTILGIGLVVFVFVGSMMLTAGLRTTLVATGSDDNVVVIRKASQTEVLSVLNYEQAQIVSTAPEIARDAYGAPMFTNEIYVLISQPKRGTGYESHVVVRGVTEKSMELRPMVELVEGRMYREGTSEVIAGRLAAERFEGCGLGETVRFGARDWTVVGIFDASRSGFDSEIWADVRQAADAFRRPVYSSLTFRMADTMQFQAMKERFESDPRLPIEAKREKRFYESQSSFTTTFYEVSSIAISIIFSLAAIVGAMITMYAAVANRTREIGALRALGFGRYSVLTAFLFESMIISFVGGLLGLLAASFLRYLQISTTNWDTFAEIVFNFDISWNIAVSAILFALGMGLIGGFLPAVRAARMKIVDALRAA
jgi:ABC-type antimicrobial peptide transport system permease subunit